MTHWEFSENPADWTTDTERAAVRPDDAEAGATASSAPSELLPDLYDPQGRRIDLATYVQLHLDNPGCEYVASDRVGPYWVSTLWFGIDAGSVPAPRRAPRRRAPAVFSTMIQRLDRHAAHPAAFGVHEHSLRYASREDARLGHDQVVERLSEATGAVRRDTTG
jgi:hypothetical protein